MKGIAFWDEVDVPALASALMRLPEAREFVRQAREILEWRLECVNSSSEHERAVGQAVRQLLAWADSAEPPGPASSAPASQAEP